MTRIDRAADRPGPGGAESGRPTVTARGQVEHAAGDHETDAEADERSRLAAGLQKGQFDRVGDEQHVRGSGGHRPDGICAPDTCQRRDETVTQIGSQEVAARPIPPSEKAPSPLQ